MGLEEGSTIDSIVLIFSVGDLLNLSDNYWALSCSYARFSLPVRISFDTFSYDVRFLQATSILRRAVLSAGVPLLALQPWLSCLVELAITERFP